MPFQFYAFSNFIFFSIYESKTLKTFSSNMKETRGASLTEQADFILKTSPKLNPALLGRLAAVQVCVKNGS
jgi:hypothetical protein